MSMSSVRLNAEEQSELALTPAQRQQFFSHFVREEKPAPRREVGEFQPIRRDPRSVFGLSRTGDELLTGIDREKPLAEQVVEILTKAGLHQHATTVAILIARATEPEKAKLINADAMLEVVASVFHCDLEDLRGPCRKPHLARARHACWWIAVKRFGMSIQSTAHWYDRDHSSIVHGIRRVDDLIRRNKHQRPMTDCDRQWLERLNTVCKMVLTHKGNTNA